MFKIELIDNSIIKNAFDSISHIVDEVVCEVDSEGFHLSALDRSHITFVTFNLNYTVFDSFECDIPEKICIDTIDFMTILKRCKSKDVLTLTADDNNLIIKFDGDVTRTFKIRLIDSEYESTKPPEIPAPVSVDIESSLLNDALSDMELFAECLNFQVDEDYFIVQTDGEFGDADFKYLHGSVVDTNEKSQFDIKKLKDIFRASKFSNEVKIDLGTDIPITFTFTLPTGDGELKYLLAPRLSED